MATRPKAVIESRNGEKFSPITIAKNVLTDDGQNLHDILSDRKEDMMTPTIENSSSMFKVGQGDNVDYSSNIVNGAYESMVLKGKTMVNCIQESSSQDVVLPYEFADGQSVTINNTKESGALGVELKGQTLVNLCQNLGNETSTSTSMFIGGEIPVKTNATYMIIVKVKSSNPLSSVSHSSFLRVDSITTGHILGGVTGDITTAYTTKSFTFNTGNTTTVKINLRNAYGDWGLTSNTSYVKEVMLIEYQEGMENWDIPYFTGMKSVEAPSIKTTGKNLFDRNNANIFIGYSSGDMCVSNNNMRSLIFKVKEGCTYTIQKTNESSRFAIDCTIEEPKNAMKVKRLFNINTATEATVTIPIGYNYIVIYYANSDVGDNLDIMPITQIEKSTTATVYEPYKSSILSLPEEVVLRGIPNGVCDVFDTANGILTKKTQEVVLNGVNEKWTVGQGSVDHITGNVWFKASLGEPVSYLSQGIVPSVADKLATYNINIYAGNRTAVGICIENHIPEGELRLQMNLPQALIGGTSIEDLKNYLKQNPVTIVVPSNVNTTKINLSSTLKSWNTTTHIYSEIPENTLYPTLSHSNPSYPVILKPSTKYSIVANSYSNNHTNSAINFNLGGATASTTVGNRVTTITTPSTLSNELLTMSGRGNKLNNVMVIEGDVVGDEPYFEGICDCKSPILSNVGENLFDINAYSVLNKYATVYENTISVNAPTGYSNTLYPIRLRAGKRYTLTLTKENKGEFSIRQLDTTSVVFFENETGNITKTFVCPEDDLQIRVGNRQTTGQDCVFKNIQIVESSIAKEYEPYKSNTTTFNQKDDKTIVLRSLPNGVCDTLNVETGEYVQRIGETVLDGSDDENWGINNTEGTTTNRFISQSLQNSNVDQSTGVGQFLCDKLKTEVWNQTSRLGLTINGRDVFIYNASIDYSASAIKQWLSQNPITVQYELATPITKTVDLSGYPFAYKNGHVVLSSGSIEQSLTPKVEYSVATNRNGQIRSNQKMVERHQKQLDRLQAMILTNLVNTQYEQTLTNLKYDLKNVREEVK